MLPSDAHAAPSTLSLSTPDGNTSDPSRDYFSLVFVIISILVTISVKHSVQLPTYLPLETLLLSHFIVKFTISVRARINFKMQGIQRRRQKQV